MALATASFTLHARSRKQQQHPRHSLRASCLHFSPQQHSRLPRNTPRSTEWGGSPDEQIGHPAIWPARAAELWIPAAKTEPDKDNTPCTCLRTVPGPRWHLQLLGTAGECLVLCCTLLAGLVCRLDALLESIRLLTALGVQVEGDGLHLVGGQLQPSGSGWCGHSVCLPALPPSNSLTLTSKEEPQDLLLRQEKW